MPETRPILIDLSHSQAAFLSSLAHLLQREVPVVMGLYESDMRRTVEKHFDWPPERVVMIPEGYKRVKPIDPMAEARRLEMKYGEPLAMVASYDRALGKGYLFNADRHPDVIRSWWSQEEKYESLIHAFRMYEKLLDALQPRAIISICPKKVLSLVARARGIPCLGIMSARVGDCYCFVDNEHLYSKPMRDRVTANLERSDQAASPAPAYLQISDSKKSHNLARFSYVDAFRRSVHMIAKEVYKRLRGRFVTRYQKEASYSFCGWVPSLWRKVHAHRHFIRHGVRPDDLGRSRVVYFPLHVEPEVALLAVSPEFNNSLEAIAWISKSLPADTVLVVKEHLFSFGIRSMTYYHHLQRIPNVLLAHPDHHSWDWIKRSALIATITGSVGFEGVYFDRPVLSFGAHQVINRLPVVTHVDSFASVNRAVSELLSNPPAPEVFERSKRALYDAQVDASFPAPDLGHLNWDRNLHLELAEPAVETLRRLYPSILSGNEPA